MAPASLPETDALKSGARSPSTGAKVCLNHCERRLHGCDDALPACEGLRNRCEARQNGCDGGASPVRRCPQRVRRSAQRLRRWSKPLRRSHEQEFLGPAPVCSLSQRGRSHSRYARSLPERLSLGPTPGFGTPASECGGPKRSALGPALDAHLFAPAPAGLKPVNGSSARGAIGRAISPFPRKLFRAKSPHGFL